MARNFQESAPMREATFDETKGEITLTIIQPGINSSGKRMYPANTLKRDYRIFEGLKMFIDHATTEEEKQRPEGSVRNWAGNIREVWAEPDGKIKGKAVIIDPDLKAKLSNLSSNGLLKEMGISIRAVGAIREKSIEGKPIEVVEGFIRGRSVDFVTYPGAGGEVEIFESAPEENAGQTGETMESEKPMEELKASLQKAETELAEARQYAAELEKKAKAAEEAAEEAAHAKRIAEASAELDRVLAASGLPAIAKTRLLERYKDSETCEGLTEAVAVEVDYVKEIQALVAQEEKKPKVAGTVRGFGESAPAGKTDSAGIKNMFKSCGLSEVAAEIAAKGR